MTDPTKEQPMYANTAMPAATVANDQRAPATALEQDIIAHAVLVATAFRLRDEDALVDMLRRLTATVNQLEAQNGQ